MPNRYSYCAVQGSGGLADCHYRITDNGDAIGTCYVEAHAKAIVNHLNRSEAAIQAIRYAQERLAFATCRNCSSSAVNGDVYDVLVGLETFLKGLDKS
jgi:hypothetical protein